MPTYEYVCTSCQNEWEEIQKISEPALEVCPKCGKSSAKRQISGGNFILKGGGWYADLYSSAKKPNGKSDAKTEKSEGSAGAGEKKSESSGAKPDAGGSDSSKGSGGSDSSKGSGSSSSGSSGSSAGGSS